MGNIKSIPGTTSCWCAHGIDGDIGDEVWISLGPRFFRANELVLRYFDPKRYWAEFGPELARYRQFVPVGVLTRRH